MNRWAIQQLTETDYPAVRRVMGAERVSLDDAGVEAMLARVFPDASPDDVEDFMRTLQRFGRDAAPVAARALPGALQGAVQGGMIGGPWGAVAGGLIGGATGALAPPSPRPSVTRPAMVASPVARPSPTPPTPVVPPSPPLTAAPGQPQTSLAEPSGAGAALVAGPAAASASTQLLALMSRPETIQALLALALQTAGRPAVPVGTHQVAPATFANAIAELASIAAADDRSPSAESAGYLFDASGWPRGDLANPAERAAILLGDLADVAAAEAAEAAELGPVDSYEMAAREVYADV